MKKFLVLVLSALLIVSTGVLCACTGDYVSLDGNYTAETSTGSVNFASLSLDTDKVEKTSKNILNKAINDYNGLKVSIKEYYYDDGDDSSYLTIKIPNENLDAFIEYVKGLNDVEIMSRDFRSFTVGNEYQTYEEKIETLETKKTSYTALLEEATTVADILAVQAEIDSIEAQLISLKKAKDYYSINLNYTTVYINIFDCSMSCGDFSAIGIALIFEGINVLAIILAIVFGVKYSNAKRKLKQYEKGSNQPVNHTYQGGNNN